MKKLFILYFSVLFSLSVFSQVSFTAQSKKIVRVGEAFRLDFTVNAQASGFRAPKSFPGFDIVSGPSSSYSSGYSSINGQVTQTVTNTYSYYLRASKKGKFTIPESQITVAGKNYTSNTFTIEVLESEAETPNTNGGAISADDLFVRVNISKTNVFKGEHIVATIKIYTKIDLISFNNISYPSFDGFWKQDIESSGNIVFNQENINGKIYDVGILEESILYPQQHGVLTISPVEIELYIKQKVGVTRDFFGRIVDQYDKALKTIKSQPVKITVKALPDNKPDNFSGISGTEFKLSGEISKKELNVTDGTNITLKLSGKGNLNLITKLDLNVPKEFEKYEPTLKESISNSIAGTSGTKTFDYLLQALTPGEYTIPPVEFCYFDINEKKYKTLKTEAFTLKVNGDANSAAEIKKNYTPQKEIEDANNDIRYIKHNNIELIEKGSSFVNSNIFYALYGFSFLIFIFVVLWKRKQIKENSDIAKVNNKKAGKTSKKRLKTAEVYLKNTENNKFYAEIISAVSGYLSDKLSIPVSELSKEKIIEKLLVASISQSTVNDIIELLNDCEYAQYAPLAAQSTPENIYKKASGLIDDLENNIKLKSL